MTGRALAAFRIEEEYWTALRLANDPCRGLEAPGMTLLAAHREAVERAASTRRTRLSALKDLPNPAAFPKLRSWLERIRWLVLHAAGGH